LAIKRYHKKRDLQNLLQKKLSLKAETLKTDNFKKTFVDWLAIPKELRSMWDELTDESRICITIVVSQI
jgi:hypothetical protein